MGVAWACLWVSIASSPFQRTRATAARASKRGAFHLTPFLSSLSSASRSRRASRAVAPPCDQPFLALARRGGRMTCYIPVEMGSENKHNNLLGLRCLGAELPSFRFLRALVLELTTTSLS